MVGGDNQKDWLRTDTFIEIVSAFSKHDDVKEAGGFMVIRPQNYTGAQPYIYHKDDVKKMTKYSPKEYDLTYEYNHNLYGIPNLKPSFKAQIHDQKCQDFKTQMFRWKDAKIYNKQKTAKQEFEQNVMNGLRNKSGLKHLFKNSSHTNSNGIDSKKNKKKKKKKEKKERVSPKKKKHKTKKKKAISFDVVEDTDGSIITQTLSGRIIKVSDKKKKEQDMYKQLDAYLEGKEDINDKEEESDSSTTDESDDSDNDNNDNRKRKRDDINDSPKAKKRKLSDNNDQETKPKIQIKGNVFTLDYSSLATKTDEKIKKERKQNNGNIEDNSDNNIDIAMKDKYKQKTMCIIKSSQNDQDKPKLKYQYPFQLKTYYNL